VLFRSEVFAHGTQVRLTKTEFAILKLLIQNASQVVTKSQILDLISKDTPDCMESSLKVHISNLRRKLRDITDQDFIEAVWGIGFKMREL
jgi:two-component system OmpR family response regulator